MSAPTPIDLNAALDALEFLPDRTPDRDDYEVDWAARVADYRDGGIFAVHYAGESQWERHGVGDEVVIVLEGSTTMTMVVDGVEQQHTLGAMQMVIVPQGVWHRFVTPDEVKVMTVTPQPTDHRIEHPLSD